jgi:CRISPR system Cascade subunit CasE
MSLYISRLCLNPLFAPALRLAADPYELHRKLLETLPCVQSPKPHSGNQPKTADLLFRVDATDCGPVILLQTNVVPDWDALELAPRALRCLPETKERAINCAPGQRLSFRLLCRPSVRKSGQFGLKPNGKRMPGTRTACLDDDQCHSWLRRKAIQGGFVIESVGLSVIDWRNTKRLQDKGGSPVETHEQARKRAFGPGECQRLGAVRFDGILVVTDPVEQFPRSLSQGIGTAKAFGFGLLSVAPA